MRIEADKPVYPGPEFKWKRAFIRLEDGAEYPLNRVTEEVLAEHLKAHPGLVGLRGLPWMVARLRETNEVRLWPTPDRACELELSADSWPPS